MVRNFQQLPYVFLAIHPYFSIFVNEHTGDVSLMVWIGGRFATIYYCPLSTLLSSVMYYVSVILKTGTDAERRPSISSAKPVEGQQ
jgi:hypothetical protein